MAPPPASEPVRAAVVAPTQFAYGREVALGFQSVAATKGWLVELIPTSSSSVRLGLIQWDPRVIVLAYARAYEDVPTEMRSRVIVGTEYERPGTHLPRVMVEDAAVGRLAAEHFAELGLKSVGAFGFSDPGFARRRFASFEEACRGLGLRTLGRYDQVEAMRAQAGAPGPGVWLRLREWLAGVPGPVGLFCGCDNWARAALVGCRATGLRVPEDVAILGVDNDEVLCDLVHPPLSSVAIPWDRMGAAAADLADLALRGEPTPADPVLIPPTGVAARRSTDILAIADPDVAAAVTYIREHALLGTVRIEDILRVVPVGRHRLHRAFQRDLGRTIMGEVRRVRVDHAKKLLVGTDHTLAEVAKRSGFPNHRKLNQAFLAQTGESARAWRERFRG